MANEELVTLLKRGTALWNAWRLRNRTAPADLSGAPLRGLDLTKADLDGADLSGADLRGAVLTDAKLVGACLLEANLFKAELDGADLTNADLRGTQFLNCAQLESALNWQSAFRDMDLACGARIPRREG